MAHTVLIERILDERKFTIIKATIKGDSADATELTDYVLFDASTYLTKSTDNKIIDITYCLNGFSIELFWDATTNVPIISLAKDHHWQQCYLSVGGLVNRSGAGRTGDILLTTNGLSSTTKDGYILLRLGQENIPDSI